MTEDQIKTFREEFASIVFWFGEVKSQAGVISRLESWNKGGSHDKAIIKAIDTLNSCRKKLREKLKGKSYAEWRDFSKNLTALNGKLKRSVNDATRQKWQKEIDNATFVL